MAACSIGGTNVVHASPESRALTREGYAQAYELNFETSLAALAEARRLDPEDPGPLRATAAVTWMEILFLQGVATYAAFQGSPSADTVARPPVPSHLGVRFNDSIQEALSLAQRAARQSGSADARYQLGATLGLSALYRGTVEGRAFAAFMDGRRAVSIMKELREAEPHRRESGLVLGIYRYAVSTLPWHKRLLATVAGMPGDKHGGFELLESAAGDGAETASDASLVLMIAYNREGRHHDALRHLKRLNARHPGNRLLRLNLASTALDAADHATAERMTSAGPNNLGRPAVLGERALWLYVRGAARAAMRDPRAEADLRQATQEEPRDWVRARAHVELAKLALGRGDEPGATVEIDAALYFAKRGNDDVAVERAERVTRRLRR